MASNKLEPYHFAWLSTHPERDALWLVERLRDGFDIHHLDGDHSNNEPDNLVLIEAGDHLRLHGGISIRRIRTKKTGRKPETIRKLREAYHLKAQDPKLNWGKIGILVSLNPLLANAVRELAAQDNLSWPPSSLGPVAVT